MKTIAVVRSKQSNPDNEVLSEAIYLDGVFWDSFDYVSSINVWEASQPGDPIVYRYFEVDLLYNKEDWPETLDEVFNILE